MLGKFTEPVFIEASCAPIEAEIEVDHLAANAKAEAACISGSR